jgi:hypothetical protein
MADHVEDRALALVDHRGQAVDGVGGWLWLLRASDRVEAIGDDVFAGLLAAAEVVAGARDAIGPVKETAFGLRGDANGATTIDEAIGAKPLAHVRGQENGF